MKVPTSGDMQGLVRSNPLLRPGDIVVDAEEYGTEKNLVLDVTIWDPANDSARRHNRDAKPLKTADDGGEKQVESVQGYAFYRTDDRGSIRI